MEPEIPENDKVFQPKDYQDKTRGELQREQSANLILRRLRFRLFALSHIPRE